MKRRIIPLMLALVLCLSLCACSYKLSEEQTEAVCGTWYLREYQEKEENPGYFELNSDGTGSFNGQEAFTWTALKDRNDESLLNITIKMESKEKHTFSLYTGDPDYIDAWLTMDEEGPSYNYAKVSTNVETAWFNEILTEWYPQNEDNTVAQSVILNADGTVKVDGESFFWTTENGVTEPNDVYLFVFNDQGVRYSVSASARDNGLYDFNLYDRESGWGSGYYNHPMLNMLNNGSWRSFDRNTMIDDYLYLSPWSSTSGIADVEYDVAFDTMNGTDTLTVNFMDGDTARYTATVMMDGEYPMVTLTDLQSGQETLYYNDYYGYAEDHPDALYYKTINLVYQYANGYSIYDEETEEYLNSDEKLPYIYEKLTALGDYKQTQEFLDRFTIVPSKLTEVTQYNTDKLNNVSDSWLSQYGYDENGVMIWGRGEDIVEAYGVYDTYDTQYLSYDASGKISEVKIGYSDTIEALGTPIYDTVDKMVGMDVQERSDAYTSVFTYDAQGRVIHLEIGKGAYGDPVFYDYTYDDAGKLTTKVKSWWDGHYVTTSNYTYDGDALVEMQQHRLEWNKEYTVTYTYTNDEQGRPLSAVITTTDPDNTYKTQEVRYTYKDLYFFDSTGLVSEED